MNEMYDMSIVTHNYGVMSVLGVILVNVIMLLSAKDVRKYTRAMRIFMPIGSTAIGIVIFTGVVMMASKHLEFSTANIAMIIFAIILIFLEVKRSSKLKYLDRKQHSAFLEYKSLALKILLIEVAVTLSISLWMWI
jgi:hypothetical protein